MKNNLVNMFFRLLFVFGASAASFYGGHYAGTRDADVKALALLTDAVNRASLDNYVVLRGAIEQLREGNKQQAEDILMGYLRLQAPSAVSCLRSPGCTRTMSAANSKINDIESFSSIPPGN